MLVFWRVALPLSKLQLHLHRYIEVNIYQIELIELMVHFRLWSGRWLSFHRLLVVLLVLVVLVCACSCSYKRHL